MPTLFPFQPTELTEVLRFNTDIRRTLTGEYRDSLMDGDYVLRMGLTMLHETAARAEGLIRSNPADDFQIPMWQDVTRVETTIASGATTIPVNTDADYRAGGLAVIIKDDQQSEVVTVTSATGGTLTCSATSAAYNGTPDDAVFVAPAVTGKLPAGLGRQDGVRVSTLSAEFICPDPEDIANALFPAHRTYDVCTDESILFGSLDGAFSQMFESITNAFGHIDLEEWENYARHYWSMTAFDTDQTSRFNRRRWIHRLRGRDMPFWMPSWKNDLPLRSAVASAATTARVQRITPVEADMVGRSIQFRLLDGTVIQSEVTGSAAVGGDPTSLDLTIAAPGQDVPTTAIVSLMHLVRLDADEIEIVHTAGSNGLHSALTVPVVEIQA